MGMRLGLGPVFAVEWVMTARKRQVYLARAGFVLLLLAALWVVWLAEVKDHTLATIRAQAQVGQYFYVAIVGTELALVLLAGPAATAGAICLDRARGTLTHLLVTDLSDAEIVLGKLAARLVPVVGLVGGTLPVMALSILLGGIDPMALFGAWLVTLGTGLLASSLAMLLSVWGQKTHEVLLATYGLLLFWVLGGPTFQLFQMSWGVGWSLPDWFTWTNPYWLALAPSWKPGAVGLGHDIAFLAGSLAVSLVMTAVATWRVRAVATRQGERPSSGKRFRLPKFAPGRWLGWIPGPGLDPNPVLWREWHRHRSSRWGRALWTAFGASALLCTGMIVLIALGGGARMRMEICGVVVGGMAAVGLLLLSVTAATSLAEERVQGSLDVLMATPMSTRSIVWAKWWGTYRTVLLLTVLPGLSTLALGLRAGSLLGPIMVVAYLLAFGAALTSFGLLTATWVPRLGHAVAATVAGYVLTTVGWFFMAVVLTMNSTGLTGPGLASGSPFMGVAFPAIQMQEPSVSRWAECIIWMLFWIVVYSGAAVVMLAATLATFDRSLGRVRVPLLADFDPPPNWSYNPHTARFEPPSAEIGGFWTDAGSLPAGIGDGSWRIEPSGSHPSS